MKKSLFLMAIATVAISSCSSDETLQVNRGNSIEFRAAMGTRATEMKTDLLGKFQVTALTETNPVQDYFTSVVFTKETSTNTFVSPTGSTYYWPVDKTNLLNFYAWHPIADDMKGSKTIMVDGTEQTIAFTPTTTVKDQDDLIVAHAIDYEKDKGANGVPLTFTHALSQIIVKAKNGNGAYKVSVKGVRIGSVISSGTVKIFTKPNEGNDVANATTPGSDKTNYTVEHTTTNELGGTAESLMGDANAAMLIPQDLTNAGWQPATDATNKTNKGAYISVLIDLDTKDGADIYPEAGDEINGGYAWAAIPITTKWERNTKYVYTLDFAQGAGYVDPDGEDGDGTTTDPTDPWQPGEEIISGDPIKFATVIVSDWTPTDPAETVVEMKTTTTTP